MAVLWLAMTAGLSASGRGQVPAADRAPPNILYILLDDLHYDDLSVYGGERIRTPHIERLAREGMVFTQHYANGPVCTPTRVALLTGQYPHRYNMKYVVRQVGYPGPTWRSGASGRGLPDDVVTVAEVLSDQGYRTAQIGKWHAGRRRPEYRPIHQGFDHSVLSLASPDSIHRNVVMLVDDQTRVKTTGHLTDVATDYALRFLESSKGQPFFVNLWYVSPHTPLEPPARWAKKYEDSDVGRFAAMVSHVDEQVGRLLAALEEDGRRKNTLILFASDNGGEPATHRGSSLRGYKWSLFEGGIRVPLIASWPKVIPAGAVRDDLILSFDLLPTLGDLVGADLSGLALDGRSFAPALRGEDRTPADRTLFWEYIGRRHTDDTFAVRRGRWKLHSSDDTVRLFDLANDPGERRDLAAAEPEIAGELLEEYGRWRMEERRLPYAVASTQGKAERLDERGADVRFDEPGGSLQLAPDPLLDFHDGDFSFAAWLRAKPGDETAGTGTIASKPGSWSLSLDAARQTLRLRVEGEESEDEVTELVSSEPLVPAQWHHVAFTVSGSISSNSVIRLYLDGRLQGESRRLLAVRPGSEILYLGSDSDSDSDSDSNSGTDTDTDSTSETPTSWFGELRGLRMYLMPLSDDEVRELAATGCPAESRPDPGEAPGASGGSSGGSCPADRQRSAS